MLKEFRDFAMKGNVLDMAVGVIIGAAFGKIVDSLVKDIIMPPMGLLMGGVDFANMFAVIKQGTTAGPYTTVEVAQKAGAVTWNYGMFINTILTFIIVAFAIFMLLKAYNKAKAAEPPPASAPPATAEEVLLLREIRDALKK
jgi:large conductance mechanosensitive channel